MATLQILSQKPSFYDEWFESYDVSRQFYSHERDFRGLLAPKPGNSPKLNFFNVLWCVCQDSRTERIPERVKLQQLRQSFKVSATFAMRVFSYLAFLHVFVGISITGLT